MSTVNRVLETIKKLLRMRRGGTQDEIATALALAAELARKHGIDLASVDPDAPDPRPVTHQDILKSSRLQWEVKYAALVCKQFFNVEVLLRAGPWTPRYQQRYQRDHILTFIGAGWDMQIAEYVHAFLIREFRQSWNRHSGRVRNRHAFLHGMYCGICEKLKARRPKDPGEPGLVRVQDQMRLARKEYLKRLAPQSKDVDTTPDKNRSNAGMLGYLAGQNVEIRPGLGSKEAPAQVSGSGCVSLALKPSIA